MGFGVYSGFRNRASETEYIEPRRRYYFICEGENTEVWYFKRMIDRQREFGIKPPIEICLIEKTEEDKSVSNPKRLLEFGRRIKKSSSRDMTVIVFDADIYERLPADEFDSLLREKDDLIFAVTNPSFELFLLLHFEEAYIKWIKPNEREILTPSKTGQKSYICTLFSEISGMNPKKNPKVGLFADRVLSAIREEKLVNQNVSLTRGRITSTVGMVIDHIRSDNA